MLVGYIVREWLIGVCECESVVARVGRGVIGSSVCVDWKVIANIGR